ncbi:DUF6520 family protein [Flavivirga rizhaonensis]|uniref:Uncharacterized protein n=1 Tax=Flavivirga rizhaonensis TaxID=2559571 RepID=A0A4S1E0J5_9FLAO|nr:DUF6520 family protein [Flavivirga rizhaonensis]TGV04057.1 hypothetical protein EM932_04475 [Flavivirga rizhaonensis]
MRTIFFRTVLPAFALMIAITASLAFASDQNDMADEDATVNTAYDRDPIELYCIIPYPVNCSNVKETPSAPLCTINNGTTQVYQRTHTVFECTVVLWEKQP